jgi:hypothetical protein
MSESIEVRAMVSVKCGCVTARGPLSDPACKWCGGQGRYAIIPWPAAWQTTYDERRGIEFADLTVTLR